MMQFRDIRDVRAIDWSIWQPQEKAVLCYIVTGQRILFIHKKKGLGAGKISGPGGRIEPGEGVWEAVVRECKEELNITPTGLRKAAELSFQFISGYSMHGTVFIGTGLEGVPTETEEAAPLWCSLDSIPYNKMWADDIVWLPQVLNGYNASGWFIFEEDAMISDHVQFDEDFSPIPYFKNNSLLFNKP